MPKYNIAILCSAFELVKQFFLWDSFSFDLVTQSLTVFYYWNCS